MKCQATVEGKVCGSEIPPNTNFCPDCGNKVVEDDSSTRPCPRCSSLVTERQRFCTSCGLRVDLSIFQLTKVLCHGFLDGKPCGAELLPTAKFCHLCGTPQSQNIGDL